MRLIGFKMRFIRESIHMTAIMTIPVDGLTLDQRYAYIHY